MTTANKDTREQVLLLKQQHPNITLEEIGNSIQPKPVTKQRVRQILMDEGIPTKRPYKKYSFVCNWCCLNYSLTTHDLKNRVVSRNYCSKECETSDYQSKFTQLKCNSCGKDIELEKRQYKFLKDKKQQKHFYCSRDCTYKGFSKYPGNRINNNKSNNYGVSIESPTNISEDFQSAMETGCDT